MNETWVIMGQRDSECMCMGKGESKDANERHHQG